MKASEIITADSLERNVDPQKVLKSIAYMVQNGNATLIHSGNTVLLLIKFSPRLAELHLFTQDSPLALAAALKKFVESIRNTNLDAVYGKADNDGILKMLRSVGVDVEESNMPQYNWMAKV